jgi:D-alanyl-D-alanine carboxypeptidase
LSRGACRCGFVNPAGTVENPLRLASVSDGMNGFPPGLRCRIGGVLFFLIVGNALPAGSATRAVALTPRMERVPPSLRFGWSPTPSECRPAASAEVHPSAPDAAWERRLDGIADRWNLGLAVGGGRGVAFAHDGAGPRIPASNQKLLLSMVLLDRLGPGFQIPTRAAAEKIDHETVLGDLWVMGHGDPTLTAAAPGYWGDVQATTLANLAARIKRAGISHINGRIMAAKGYFAHDMDAPGWQPYVPHRYVQLPSSLVLNGNNRGGLRPELAVASALTRQLEAAGISVSGAPGTGEPPGLLEPVARVRSRPLARLVAYMNQTSNNFHAEVLGKLLGADVYGAPGTIQKGARAIEAWVRAHGARVVANDSSGLSYRNRVAPRTLVKLLGVAQAETWGRALRNGLPGPGQGTLRYRLRGINVRAKTGSLFNGASALSGWLRPTTGRRWVRFSILSRNAPKTIEDRIVRIISGVHIRLPDRGRGACGGMAGTPSGKVTSRVTEAYAKIQWRRSIAVGAPTDGRLVKGVQLPSEGRHFFTWDPVGKRSPNRGYRRYGTDRLIRIVLRVLRTYRSEHPAAPRVAVGDLSRRHGGDFGPRFGGLGHSSHQNGLDVDIYYPRRDRHERSPLSPRQIDRALAQDLVDRFVRAGAEYVFVGPRTGLTGPRRVVQVLVHHDDHMHVRIPPR